MLQVSHLLVDHPQLINLVKLKDQMDGTLICKASNKDKASFSVLNESTNVKSANKANFFKKDPCHMKKINFLLQLNLRYLTDNDSMPILRHNY